MYTFSYRPVIYAAALKYYDDTWGSMPRDESESAAGTGTNRFPSAMRKYAAWAISLVRCSTPTPYISGVYHVKPIYIDLLLPFPVGLYLMIDPSGG